MGAKTSGARVAGNQESRLVLGNHRGPVPHVGHTNYGVWKFKRGFGGQWVVYLDRSSSSCRALRTSC